MSEDFPVLAGFRAGSLVAGYRLEAQVGAGGMAVVFRARDERLGRLVALKILSPALAVDAGFRRRFIGESRAAAVVDDPHIIPVFEAGESGGVLFIAMRFVAGGDLRGVLVREGPLPPGRAAGFISPVASALDAAHRAGLVHRDVKPANVLVDAQPGRPDHVYLSDFGVSKGAVSSVSLTGTGHFLGTPDYSAPEQVQGRAVDGRVDQYALACVAFQLLAGSVPFERDQGMAVLLAHLSEPPPPLSSRRAGLPAAADQVLARAMAKVPEKRYGSCREFADALREALGVAPYTSPGIAAPGHPSTEISAPRAGFSAPVPALAAGAVGLPDPAAALTVDSAHGSGQASTAEVSQAAPGAMEHRQDPPGPGPERTPGTSAARDAALSQQAAAPARLTKAIGRPWSFRLRVAVGLAAVLAVAASLSAFALSSRGAGTHSGNLSRPIAILTDPGSNGVDSVAFSPAGTTLAVGDSDGRTFLWSLATRTITATLTDPVSRINGVDSVAFSRGGTTLAADDSNGSTYLWSLATRTITATLTDPGNYAVDSVAFSRDGTTLAVGDENGSIYLWSLATRTITATLTGPGIGSYGVASVAFSPDGTTLAAANGYATYLWSLATRTITAALVDPGSSGVDSVAFSPDGTTLAVGDENGSTYLWSLATRTITATLTDPVSSSVASVAFSPAGTTLAADDSNGSTYLWSLATRTITATLTDPGNYAVDSVSFSPAGTTLASSGINGGTYLWHVPGLGHASS